MGTNEAAATLCQPSVTMQECGPHAVGSFNLWRAALYISLFRKNILSFKCCQFVGVFKDTVGQWFPGQTGQVCGLNLAHSQWVLELALSGL